MGKRNNANSEPESEPVESSRASSPREGSAEMNESKGQRLWKKMKYQLVEYHSLPGYLRDNEFIVGHYRCEWPLKQVLLSIFSIHNETLNVWTHLIGFFLFLCLTVYTATKVPSVVDLHSLQEHVPEMLKKADLHRLQECLPSWSSVDSWHVTELLYNCLPERFSHKNSTDICVLRSLRDEIVNRIIPIATSQPITRWPFFAFMGGAMFCLLASSTCHLLSCHSERVSYIMLRLDYAGIAALIATSFYPPVYYSFLCFPFLRGLYLSSITLLGLATVVFSLLPVFQNPEFRTVRASLFFGMGLSGAVPILHKLYLFWGRPEAFQTTGYEALMGFFYGLGALLYATRVPERWRPGKFDIAGHSHQLFHVLVIAGAFTHYLAGLVYLRWRDLEGCS